MYDLAPTAQYPDLPLYRWVQKVNVEIGDAPQILPFEITSELCAGLGIPDSTPPVFN
jgi:hypothetical protein